MNRNPKEMTKVPSPEEISETFDVEALLARGGEVLKREIRHLMRESANGKLGASSARDLVAYLRLLSELKIEEEKIASELTEEELKSIASRES